MLLRFIPFNMKILKPKTYLSLTIVITLIYIILGSVIALPLYLKRGCLCDVIYYYCNSQGFCQNTSDLSFYFSIFFLALFIYGIFLFFKIRENGSRIIIGAIVAVFMFLSAFLIAVISGGTSFPTEGGPGGVPQGPGKIPAGPTKTNINLLE